MVAQVLPEPEPNHHQQQQQQQQQVDPVDPWVCVYVGLFMACLVIAPLGFGLAMGTISRDD
jgi:hypothetical protein